MSNSTEKTLEEDDALTELGGYAIDLIRDYGCGLYPREIGARLLSKAVAVCVARPIGATMKDGEPWVDGSYYGPKCYALNAKETK